jgi:hypothetical protein
MNTYQGRFKQNSLQISLAALQAAIERVTLLNQFFDSGAQPREAREVLRAVFARLLRLARFITNSVTRCDPSRGLRTPQDSTIAKIEANSRKI